MNTPLWTPSPERIATTRMTAFVDAVEARHGVRLDTYATLFDWSLRERDDFWRLMWEFGGIRGAMGERVVEHPERMPGARFFPDARLNFAENLLRRRDEAPAIVFRGEGGRRRTLSFAELFEAVAGFATALRDAGISPATASPGISRTFPKR